MDPRLFNYQNNLNFSNDTNSTIPTSLNRQFLFPPPPVAIPSHSTEFFQQVHEPTLTNDTDKQALPPTLPLGNTNNLQNMFLRNLDPNLLNQQYVQAALSSLLPLLNTNQSIQTEINSSNNLNNEVNMVQSTNKSNTSNVMTIDSKSNSNEKQGISSKRKSEYDDGDKSDFKPSETRETRVLIGSIEKVIYWNKVMPPSCFCLYEVIASCVSIRESAIPFRKNLLLRNDRGPILQVTFYETQFQLDDFILPGKLLRCIGRMVTTNRLVAFKINIVPESIKNHLELLSFRCDHMINRLIHDPK